jgi:hypothetical protein
LGSIGFEDHKKRFVPLLNLSFGLEIKDGHHSKENEYKIDFFVIPILMYFFATYMCRVIK